MPTTRLAMLLIAPLLSTGCFVNASASVISSSKFVYPNSNVTPLTETSGSHAKLCGFIITWGGPDADDIAAASREAIAKVQGADLLIDAHADNFMMSGPIYPLFSYCSVHVNGTAAKMEVGKQDLTAGQPRPKVGPAPAMRESNCRQGVNCINGDVCDPDGTCKAAAPRVAPVCAKDRDCAGMLVCSNGACVAPPGN